MPYNRQYTLQEVVEILAASETRPRPAESGGNGATGHAISMHSQERASLVSRSAPPGKKLNYPKADSTFLVDRNSLAAMVHEALNSPSGQRELEKLAHQAEPVEIRSVILRQGSEVDVFTVYRPKKGQTSVDWLSASPGDGCIIQVYVMVCKIPNASGDAIHIQTAFPEDYARTQGDTILRAAPRPGSKYFKP